MIVLPVSIAFYSDDQMQPEWLTISIAVDVLFITDVFVNFRTGFIVQNNQHEVRMLNIYNTQAQLIMDPTQMGIQIVETKINVDAYHKNYRYGLKAL